MRRDPRFAGTKRQTGEKYDKDEPQLPCARKCVNQASGHDDSPALFIHSGVTALAVHGALP
jgi:hypothetical protein